MGLVEDKFIPIITAKVERFQGQVVKSLIVPDDRGAIRRGVGELLSAGIDLLVTTAVSDVRADVPRGAINGGLFPFKADWPDQYPSVVIGVEDIQAAMRRVVEAGGLVLGEPMTIPGVGPYVSFRDTEGNRLSMMQAQLVDGG